MLAITPGQDDDCDDTLIVFWPAHPGGLYASDPGRPDGDLVHVEDAPRGASGLLCPECRGELVAKKGAVRAHHFAHRGAGGGDDVPACARAGETALHRLAKEIIVEEGGLQLPAVSYRSDGGAQTLRDARWCAFHDARLEPREAGMRPDLIVSHHGPKGLAELAVEIHVTHRVGADKRARFAALDLPAIEIDLSRVDRKLDRAALASLILRRASRSWLFNRMARDAQARVDADAVERRRKQEADEARIQAARILERRAAEYEMRDVLRVRKQARRTARRGTDPATRVWAEAKLADWSNVTRIGAVKKAGADHPFEAEATVWRAVVLDQLASCPGDVGLKTIDIAVATAAALRQRGFVKAGYMTAVPDPPGGHPSGDPVRDACRQVLEAVAASTPSGSTVPEMLAAIKTNYSFQHRVRDHLQEIARLAAERGATARLRGSTIGENISWATARELSVPRGDGHAPSPSDLRSIMAALGSDQPRVPAIGRGPDPVLSAAARLDLKFLVDGEDRTAALLAGLEGNQ